MRLIKFYWEEEQECSICLLFSRFAQMLQGDFSAILRNDSVALLAFKGFLHFKVSFCN